MGNVLNCNCYMGRGRQKEVNIMDLHSFTGQNKGAPIFLGYFLHLSGNFLIERIAFSLAHVINT